MDTKTDKAKRMAGSNAAGASGKSALKSTEAGATGKTSATTLAGSRLGNSSVGASASAAAKATKPIEEVKDGESSGYSDFQEEEIE